MRQDEYAEAEEALMRAFDIIDALTGADAGESGEVMQLLVDLYEASGAPDQAAQWRGKLAQWQATTQPATTQPAVSKS